MSRLTQGSMQLYAYGAVTRYGRTFQTVLLTFMQTTGLFRFRSPLLAESLLMSFPPGTEMFQFPGFASYSLCIQLTIPHRGGLPHSDIHGSTPARGSPWLFAACHVLHRLLVPRHPPNALLMLEITRPPRRDRRLTMHRNHPQITASATAESSAQHTTRSIDPAHAVLSLSTQHFTPLNTAPGRWTARHSRSLSHAEPTGQTSRPGSAQRRTRT